MSRVAPSGHQDPTPNSDATRLRLDHLLYPASGASIVIRQRVSLEDDHFKFIGCVLGLGILHQRFLDADFSVSFRKMVLKKKVTVADLESVDAELHVG